LPAAATLWQHLVIAVKYLRESIQGTAKVLLQNEVSFPSCEHFESLRAREGKSSGINYPFRDLTFKIYCLILARRILFYPSYLIIIP
jgi:hypothetical protein